MRRLSELMSLEGRGALVTGGAGHIGRAAVDALLELGARVVVMDLARAEDTANADFVACDLTDVAATRQAVAEAASRLGNLDIVVHSAAFVGTTKFPGWGVPFDEQSVEAWDACLAVNLRSVFVLAKEVRAEIQRRRHGSLILLSSIYGMVGPDMRLYEGTTMANPVAYGASKGAIIQLTRTLATQFAPGARVNALSPGGVLRGQPEVFQSRYRDRVPLGRMATEEDLKGAIAYLASDLSSYVTGHNLVVDGGWTAW